MIEGMILPGLMGIMIREIHQPGFDEMG